MSSTEATAGSSPGPTPGIATLEKLFSGIIGPLSATQVVPLLHEPDNIEDRVTLLVQTFNQNPHLIVPFKTLIKSLHAQEVEISIEEQIRFFTTKHTRYWLLVNLLNRILNLKELAVDLGTGRLPAKANDILKYSTQAAAEFGEESRYKDQIFAAGFLFDYLFYLQRTQFLHLGQAKFDEPINQAFTNAVEQGKMINKLSRHKAKLTLEKLTPVTAFMRQLSQISLVLLVPDRAPDFYKKLDPKKTTEPLRWALEWKQFGVHTGIVASYLAHSIPIFEQLGEIMSIFSFPYLSWTQDGKDIHDAAGMGELGCRMLEQELKGPAFSSGVVHVPLPELKYLDFEVNAGVISEAKI